MGSNAKTVYDYMVSKGLSPAGAAGVVGNLLVESNVNPTAQNPSGAYGIAQWMGNRKQALLASSADAAVDPGTLFAQEPFILQELKQDGLYDQLKTINDPDAAATLVMDKYEIPGNGPNHDDGTGGQRVAYARQLLAFKGNVGSATTNDAGNASSVTTENKNLISAAGGAIAAPVTSALNNIQSNVRPLVIESLVAVLGLGLVAGGVVMISRPAARKAMSDTASAAGTLGGLAA